MLRTPRFFPITIVDWSWQNRLTIVIWKNWVVHDFLCIVLSTILFVFIALAVFQIHQHKTTRAISEYMSEMYIFFQRHVCMGRSKTACYWQLPGCQRRNAQHHSWSHWEGTPPEIDCQFAIRWSFYTGINSLKWRP